MMESTNDCDKRLWTFLLFFSWCLFLIILQLDFVYQHEDDNNSGKDVSNRSNKNIRNTSNNSSTNGISISGSRSGDRRGRPLRYVILFLYIYFLPCWVFKGGMHLWMMTTEVAGRQMDGRGSRHVVIIFFSFLLFFFLLIDEQVELRWRRRTVTTTMITPSVAPEHGLFLFLFFLILLIWFSFFLDFIENILQLESTTDRRNVQEKGLCLFFFLYY